VRRENEQVERGEDARDVFAKTEEVDDVVDMEVVGLAVEVETQRPGPDDDELHVRHLAFEDLGRLEEVTMALVILELGDDADQEIVRAEAELPPQEIALPDLLEGREVDAGGDDLDELRADAVFDEDFLDALGDGDDGVDLLGVLGFRPDREIHASGDDAERNLGQTGGPRADAGAVGVVEVGQDTAAAYGRGQAEDGQEVGLLSFLRGRSGRPSSSAFCGAAPALTASQKA
jgi:hypothetical protein